MPNRAAGKATELKGKAKGAVGRLTKDRSMEAKGRATEAKGQGEQVAADLKKAGRKAKRAMTT